MSLRERAKQQKRERILNAARRLFKERGYDATTIRAVAQQARVATGTIFLYAPTKPALLALVFTDDVVEVRRRATEGLTSSAAFPEPMMQLFAAFYAYYGEDPDLSRVFLKQLLFSSGSIAEVREVTAAFVGAIGQLVEVARTRGELRADVDPEQAAGIFFALYWACLVAWLGGAMPSQEVALATLRSSIERCLDGLR